MYGLFLTVGGPVDLGGSEQETVRVEVELGVRAFERLKAEGVTCSRVWLTMQPSGVFAMGVVTAAHPREQGLEPRRVGRDDRAERFGGGLRGPS